MFIHPQFDPVAFQLGPLAVRWYGLMYLLAFVFVIVLGRLRISRQVWLRITARDLDDMLFLGVLGVVLGGRLGYVLFYKPLEYLYDPLRILFVWEGGMSFHGGLLGVTLALWVYARRIRQPFIALTDFVAPLVPLGLGFGRLGNFIGQELWGRATDVPWAMVFPKDPELLARHPSQLYQAATEGVLLFAIVYWFSIKPRPRGAVTGLFLVFYALFRMFTEFFRAPDEHIQFDLFGWVTRGQLLSVPLLLLGVGLLVYAWRSRGRAAA